MITEAQRRGARTLMLELRADNTAALALQLRQGFDRISRRRGYYDAGRVDALVLRRQLGQPHDWKRRPSSRHMVRWVGPVLVGPSVRDGRRTARARDRDLM